MKKLFKTVYYIIFVTIIFFILLLIISVLPITGNIKMLLVLSGSMEPTIHTGSVIVIRPVFTYKVNEIITFGEKADVPTTHRIINTKVVGGEMVYKTKGDANKSEDSNEIPQKEVLGKVYLSIPYLGYIVDFIKKPIGLVLIVVIPAMIIIGDEIRKIGKEIMKTNKKKAKVILKEPKNENNNE